MSVLIRLGQLAVRRGTTLPHCRRSNLYRSVFTSPKKDDNIPTTTNATENQCEPKKVWVSYGFDVNDERTDRHLLNASFFFALTLGIIVTGYYMLYMPDQKLRNWARREAYIQLRHREENGLPLIDRNYYDPARITLPTDEELGSTEIII